MRRATTIRVLAVAALLAIAIGSAGALADSGTTLTADGQSATPSFTMTLDQPSYSPGEGITVSYSGFPPGKTGEIWIEPAATPANGTKPASNSQFISSSSGTRSFGGLAAGQYQVRVADLSDFSSPRIVATDTFDVVGPGQPTGAGTPGGDSSQPTGNTDQPTAATSDPSAWSVASTKSVYKQGQRIGFNFKGFSGVDTIQIWIEPKNAPLKSAPQGPYFPALGPSGSSSLPSPGSGVYVLQWTVLGRNADGKTHRSNPFTVGATHVGRVPSGGYGCYFTGSAGLQRSSIGRLTILSSSEYRVLGKTGSYRLTRSTGVIRMTSGPLKGRVAHYSSSPHKAISFRREENTRNGRPTVDVSTTYCYFGRK